MIRIHYVPPSAPSQAEPAWSPAQDAAASRPAQPYAVETARFTRGARSRLTLSDVGEPGRLARNQQDALALSEAWRRFARSLGGEGAVRLFHDATTQLGPDGSPNMAALKQARLRLRQWARQAPREAAEGLARLDGLLARMLRRNAPTGDAAVLPPLEGPRPTRPGRQDARGLYQEGMKLWAAGRHDEALDRLEAACEKAPDQARLHYDRGRLLLEEGYYMDAEWAMLQADELKPQQPGIQAALGEIYARMGQRDLAIEAFGRAVKLAPGHTDAHAQLGVAHYEAGGLDAAARHLQQAVALDPEHVVARFYLAQVSLQENDLLRARYQLGMVQKLAPDMDLSRFGAAAPPALSRHARRPEGAHHWQLPRLIKR